MLFEWFNIYFCVCQKFSNIQIIDVKSQDLNKILTKPLRKSFDSSQSTTVGSILQPKVKGGLGTRKSSIVCILTRAAHLISMLNHDDINIRLIGRNSLDWDMRKGGVERSWDELYVLGIKCKEKIN